MRISLRGKQEVIGKAEKQHIVLGRKKKKKTTENSIWWWQSQNDKAITHQVILKRRKLSYK